ncbi:MAG: diguanylate cyclase [Dehalococcoidia bacterium]|nr:MAG: diguanylate cyclase [Dehalococcoidia bacterium]
MTGLFNHHCFHQRLDEEIGRGLRFGTAFSLILFNLDVFKRYNDIHGHLAGDGVLRHTARAISSGLRSPEHRAAGRPAWHQGYRQPGHRLLAG